MIKIENVETYGWEAAIRGMRNPMNSWEKSDSYYGLIEDPSPINPNDEPGFIVGPNDHALMMKLAKAGSTHAKYRRMITVTCDITAAPLYWWKEFDTYRMGVEKNSCSTMHTIHKREFTRDDFSIDGISGEAAEHMDGVINDLNRARLAFIERESKKYWRDMIVMLPSSYNQRRTVQMSYEALASMYHDRHNHKLDEWVEFCRWVESLPYSEIITLKEE